MNITKYIILGFLAMILFGCEDVIDIDIDSSGGDLVIDAWIDTRSQTQSIRLALSQEYFDNTNPPVVDNAIVTVTNTTTNTVNLFDEVNGSGEYKWTPEGDATLAKVGDALTLKITYNGDEYTASTIVKRVPVIDSIGQEFRENEIFLDDGIYVQFFARDFVGTGDAYWIKSFKNGAFLNEATDINIAFDAGFDAGSQIDGIVFITPIREFINAKDEDGIDQPWTKGENIMVEIHSLSTDAFNFMEIARDQITNGDNGIFSLPLANARSNIRRQSDGKSALGFFNVAAVTSRSKVIE
jgi:hypothetical protein